jgi:hypothetical protein
VRILLPSLTLLALLTGCAPSGDTGSDAAGGGQSAGSARADNDLVVRIDRGDGSAPESWTLVCADAAEGTHPDASAACAHLQAMDDPFAPIPADVACTEQYGGPQSAHIAGVWEGEPVDLEVTRVDGCRIGQWDALGPLLPTELGTAGAVAPPT